MNKEQPKWIVDFITMMEYKAQTVEDRVAVALMRGDVQLAKDLWDGAAGRRAYETEQHNKIARHRGGV